MKRTLEDLVRYLYKEIDFPHGAFLMTGAGVVPPESFSLQAGDTVKISVGEVTLENAVAFVTPFRWGGAGVRVRAGTAEETLIGYAATAREAFVDRSRLGDMSFSPRFDERHAAPCPLRGSTLALHLLVDVCFVEVFVDDGRVVISDLIFPKPESDGIECFGDDAAHVHSLDIWSLA